MNIFKQAFFSLVGVISITPSFAADVKYNAGISIAHVENVNLEAEPTEGEVATSVNAGLRIFEDTSGLLTSLDTNVTSIQYQNNTTSDQNDLNLRSVIVWRVQPKRFEWVFNDTFTQTVINSLESDSPSNRENVNVLSVGPNYTIRLNPKSDLRFESRLEIFSFEESSDSNRGTLITSWINRVNPAITLSINNEVEVTRFDDELLNTNFNRNDVFVGLGYERGLSTLQLELGYTQVTNDNLQDTNENRYLLSFTNIRTRTSSIELVYENNLSDTGRTVVASNVDEILDGVTGNTSTNDLFTNESLNFRILNTLTRGSVTYDIKFTDRRYQIQTNLDEKELEANIRGLWVLQRSSILSYSIGYRDTAFQDITLNRADEEYIYSLNYTYNLRRNFKINLGITSQERVSTSDSESFDDLRVSFSINYTSL